MLSREAQQNNKARSRVGSLHREAERKDPEMTMKRPNPEWDDSQVFPFFPSFFLTCIHSPKVEDTKASCEAAMES